MPLIHRVGLSCVLQVELRRAEAEVQQLMEGTLTEVWQSQRLGERLRVSCCGWRLLWFDVDGWLQLLLSTDLGSGHPYPSCSLKCSRVKGKSDPTSEAVGQSVTKNVSNYYISLSLSPLSLQVNALREIDRVRGLFATVGQRSARALQERFRADSEKALLDVERAALRRKRELEEELYRLRCKATELQQISQSSDPFHILQVAVVFNYYRGVQGGTVQKKT